MYEGEYLNGDRHGNVKEYDFSKLNTFFNFHKYLLKFEVEYINGKVWNGKGYDRNEKLIFEIKEGKGYIKEFDNDGNLKFEGKYLNGERNGKGKEYDDDGNLKFEGKYLNGDKHGKGKEYDDDGNLKFEGEYLKGKIWNGKGYNKNGKLDFKSKMEKDMSRNILKIIHYLKENI